MTAATFDTRAAAEALREAGFTEPQAIAAVDMVRDAMTESLATKTDIGRLEAVIGTLEARMTNRLYVVAAAIVAGNTALTIGLLRLFWPS